MFTHCTCVNYSQHVTTVTKSCSGHVQYSVRCKYVCSTNRLRTLPSTTRIYRVQNTVTHDQWQNLNVFKISQQLPADHDCSRSIASTVRPYIVATSLKWAYSEECGLGF